jgi:hypothetical protein
VAPRVCKRETDPPSRYMSGQVVLLSEITFMRSDVLLIPEMGLRKVRCTNSSNGTKDWAVHHESIVSNAFCAGRRQPSKNRRGGSGPAHDPTQSPVLGDERKSGDARGDAGAMGAKPVGRWNL